MKTRLKPAKTVETMETTDFQKPILIFAVVSTNLTSELEKKKRKTPKLFWLTATCLLELIVCLCPVVSHLAHISPALLSQM